DQRDIHIRNLDTGKDFPEVLKWCKFASIAWTKDSKGFYYNRFPEPGTVAKDDESNYNRVYWHALGTAQSTDRLIFERPDDKELMIPPPPSKAGRSLFYSLPRGTSPKNRLYVQDLAKKGPVVRLLDAEDAAYEVVDAVGRTLYVKTDLQ